MTPPPVVSIRLITFNQERYIAQCLEGILMQRTDFPFEVVVGEDHSTDATRDIVRAYANKYPDTIRLLPSAQNLGPERNSLAIQQACRGKYHAMIEGDDYWIDPLKLQKQVSLLETHPEVTLCLHNAFVLYEDDQISHVLFTSSVPGRLTFADVSRIDAPTASLVARADVLASLPAWRTEVWSGDLLFRLWCAHHGPVAYLSDIMSVYRRHAGSVSSHLNGTPAAALAGIIHLCRRFDEDTGHQHSTDLQAIVVRARKGARRLRLGWPYFLLDPRALVLRLRQISLAMRTFGRSF